MKINAKLMPLLVICLVLAFSLGAFAAEEELPFTDIDSHWSKDAVMEMYSYGIVNGYEDNTFRPDNTVTRAEFAKMLYSAVGIKNNIEDTENPFTDVTSAWYYEPVMSLYQDGIINGTSDTTFGPNENLTREQMVTLVTRAADVYDCFDLTVDKTKQLSDFSDTEQISDYATESFIYAYQTGIIAGDDGKLFPKDQSTRAQVVTVIDRCVTAEKILPTKIAQEDWVDAKEYIDLSTGLRMAYVEMGQAEGEPLILLHGHTDSSRTWSMTAQELAKDYHIYILDQRGSGDTEAPDSRAYTGVQFANDVAAFMDAVGLDKAHIVGHSMGSHIAQYLAALYPEKVDRLVLMGSAHVDADASYRDSAEMYADPDFDPSDPEFLDYWDFVTPGIWDGKEFKADAEEMLEYIKNDTAVIDRKAFVNPPMGSTVCGMTNIYDLVEAPTLLLCGESDAPNQNDLAAELKNYAGMIVYAGHGHSIQWENPYETGKDIAKFLKGEENDKMIQQWQKDLPNKISQEDWNESKQYVQLSTGIVMAYVELGDPQGEPVIMIHGFGGDTSRTFSLMAPYMAENGYHCYLIDRKGNGDSSKPEIANYDCWSEASDAAAFIDAMGYEKANIIGHSLGSVVCQCLLIQYPDMIDKMAFYPSMIWTASEFTPMQAEDLNDAYYESWIANEIPEEEWTPEYREFLEWEIFDAKRVTVDDLNRMQRGAANTDTSNGIKEVTKEFLLLWGTKDSGRSELAKLLDATENSRLLVYEGVGHNIQWEIPEQLATDIMAYFNDETPPSGYVDKDKFIATDGATIEPAKASS